MAGGIKSKFKFSVPGRSKKQQAQAVNVSGPLSKAQRILGEGGINTGPSRLAVNVDRSWESGSTGDISLSISDSNPSPTPYDGPLRKDRNHRWETEPPISPRKIKSTNDLAQKGLKIKRSAFTVGDGSRDNLDIPKETGQDKRLSSVSMDSHYDPKKMPLAISQQTSNSAMAKGLPPRPVNTGSPVPPAQSTKKKKKPAKLDLSRLRPKGYKDWNNTRDWNKSDSDFEPRYISPPQPIAPPTTEPPLPPLPPPDDQQASVYRPVRQGAVRVSPRSKGITDASGLDRLYHHYEQMSFQHEESTGKDDGVDREHTETYPEHASANKHRATGSTFDHGLVAPSPGSAPGSTPTEPTTNWGHFRRGSHDSKMTGSMTESSSVLHAQSISSRNGYPASVSSRYTRTSKATTSMRSTVESDRQQHSILSLSDSSDDEDVSSPSASASRRGSIAHSSISDHSNYSGRGQPSPTLIHGSTGPRKFRPSLHQLDEHLAVKSVAAFRAANPPANNNNNNNNATHSHSLSNHSSASTLTPSRFVPHASRSSSAQSSRHLETPDSPGLPRPSGFGFGIPESRYMPLASAVDRSTKSSLSSVSTQQQQLEKHFSRQSNTSSTARFSHTTNNTSADQPTPPLSPNSVEFYVQSRESLQRDADASSSEVNEARLMAVTKQEEMLLAALRQKRAKMRESASDDGDDDRKSRTNYSTRGSTASTGQRTAVSTANSTKGGTPTSDSNPNLNRLSTKSTVWPLGEADQQNILRIHLGNVNVPSSTSVASTSATASTTSTTFDSRNDRILFYLDQPHEDVNTAESSLDFSDDYMEDSDGDDLIANERRSSRMALRRDSAFSSSARGSSMSSRRGSSSHGSQYRKDSIPFHSLNNPPTASRLHDVPEVETNTNTNTNNTNTTNPHTENNHHHHNHHTTTNSPAAAAAAAAPGSLNGDLDTFPQPPMPPPSWPLPTPPKLTTSNLTASTSSAPPSPSPSPAQQQQQQQQQQLAPPSPRTIPVGLTPESAQTDAAKSKKALVRLSAVGFSNSPMPWWGDDD